MNHRLTPLFMVVAALATVAPSLTADARSFRISQIPNQDVNVCDACHVVPGGARTALGLQMEATFDNAPSNDNVDWSLFRGLDADGDGYTNGQEMGDPLSTWMQGDGTVIWGGDPNNAELVPDGIEPLCTEPGGEVSCDGVDNDCDGQIDEDVLNACGECGPVPEEVCDGIDNDCDGDTDEGLDCSPQFSSFTTDLATVNADGIEEQTFRLTLASGGVVDEVRMIINHPWHTENGREFDGYVRVGEGLCEEFGGLGNAGIAIGTCEVNDNLDGSREFVVNLAFETSFGGATDHVVSALWFDSGNLLSTTWQKLTTPGQGFETIADPNFSPPATFNAFSFDEASVDANGQDPQTFRLTLNDADNVDEIRVIINHPWHTENGREYDGYFTINAQGCSELGGGLGNNTVTLDTDGCTTNTVGNATEFVFPVNFDPSFGGADNHVVSALWIEGGVVTSTTWQKLTSPGAGFSTVADPNFTPPSSLRSFTFDQSSVSNDGIEVQTFRLTLNDAANVTDIRMIINFPWHTENGREYDGYFQITPEGCSELGAGLGNDTVELLDDCEQNMGMDGSVEYVLNVAFDSSFGTATNHQVSAIWYEGETIPAGTWQRLTTSGAGFDVTEPAPSTFASFAYDQPSVANDDIEVQTVRFRFNSGAAVTSVRVIINHAWHTENGREYDGYFIFGDGVCAEVGALGSERIGLLTDACEINDLGGGVFEFAASFTVNSDFPAIDNNTVSILWYEGDTLIPTTWQKVSTTGEGFNVTAAP